MVVIIAVDWGLVSIVLLFVSVAWGLVSIVLLFVSVAWGLVSVVLLLVPVAWGLVSVVVTISVVLMVISISILWLVDLSLGDHLSVVSWLVASGLARWLVVLSPGWSAVL